MVDFAGLHLETTNICTLKCPRCSRTQFLNKFGSKHWVNHNLDLLQFQKFIDVELTNKVINLCGNYGDPIYYPNLIELITWCKQQGAVIQLRTNGSYQSQEWWYSLSDILTEKDIVYFAIDGVPENFTQYRINANWDSILHGIKIISQSAAQSVWRYIPFSFNENTIDQAKQLSHELGLDRFELNVSDRWEGANDPLKPVGYNGTREAAIVHWRHNKPDQIIPKCVSGTEHFITASGHYTPCCYSADHRFYYKSEFFKNQEQYHISNTTLSTLLLAFDEFYSIIPSATPDFCTYNCPKT